MQDTSTPNLPTKNLPTKIAGLKLSGKFPLDMRIPPLKIKNMLESTPLKSRILVWRLAVRVDATFLRAPQPNNNNRNNSNNNKKKKNGNSDNTNSSPAFLRALQPTPALELRERGLLLLEGLLSAL